MTTTKLQIIPDINGKPTYTLPQSNVIYTGVLAANVAQSVTAPTDASRYMVRIGVLNGGDVLVSVNGTATVPTVYGGSAEATLALEGFGGAGGSRLESVPHRHVVGLGLVVYHGMSSTLAAP